MRQWNQPLVRFKGEYKPIKSNGSSGEADEYEIWALAKRLNISNEDMKEMSFVSLMNVLISNVGEETERKATEDDIRRFFK